MSEFRFLFPLDGDFVNSRDGVWEDGALYIDALLESHEGCPTVCGISAVYDDARVLQSCRILADKGYTGAHISEVISPRSLADYPTFRA